MTNADQFLSFLPFIPFSHQVIFVAPPMMDVAGVWWFPERANLSPLPDSEDVYDALDEALRRWKPGRSALLCLSLVSWETVP